MHRQGSKPTSHHALLGAALLVFMLPGGLRAQSMEDLFDLEDEVLSEETPAAATEASVPDTVDAVEEHFGVEEETVPATPESAEELFGVDEAPGSPDARTVEETTPATPASEPDVDTGVEDLFEPEARTAEAPPPTRGFEWLSGFWQNELAYTVPQKDHFSKWKNHLRLVAKGALSANVKWQVSGHLIYDPIYEIDNFYGDAVEDEQKFDGWFHETFLDISLGDWEIRLGRQNIVWGEAVGLFFADVVSALDLREFVLPDFDLIRIPQWALRAEYYRGDFHGEIVFIPQMTTDEIGVPGAEFYPFQVDAPAGFGVRFVDANEPGDPGEDFGFGTRLSYLVDGWDLAAFYYTSPDKSPAFQRTLSGGATPTITYRPLHERIHQLGGTLAKGFGSTVLKSEIVFTADRLVSVARFDELDGLEETDEVRFLVGLDYVWERHNFNAQFFQTRFLQHERSMFSDDVENGFSLLWRSEAWHPDLESELLWIRSLNRDEWLLEAKLTWHISGNWRGVIGADIFDGSRRSFLGRFKDTDRIYYELRYSF